MESKSSQHALESRTTLESCATQVHHRMTNLSLKGKRQTNSRVSNFALNHITNTIPCLKIICNAIHQRLEKHDSCSCPRGIIYIGTHN